MATTWEEMLKIQLRTIPHENHRYETAGDYWQDKNGSLQIRVDEMENERYEFLVMLHEMIEQFLCLQRGIKEKDITEFDKNFEEQRKMGIHDRSAEPGDDNEAPYRREHFFATSIERLVAAELGVDWEAYSNAV